MVPENLLQDVRINRRRNVVAVELKQTGDRDSTMRTLLEITRLGDFTVKAHKPAGLSTIGIHKSGVISPVGFDVNMDDLKTMLISPNKIIQCTRLFKFSTGSKQPSTAIKLDFEGDNLPSSVKFRFLSFPVKEYDPPPLRCFKCQRPGHMAAGCTARERCVICGGGHNRDLCDNRENPKCANCGDNHMASSKACIMNQKSANITKLMRTGKTFTQAKNIVDDKYKTLALDQHVHPNMPLQPNTPVTSNKSYRNAVASRPNTGSEPDHITSATSSHDQDGARERIYSGAPSHQEVNRRETTNNNVIHDMKKELEGCLSEFLSDMTKMLKEVIPTILKRETQITEATFIETAKRFLTGKLSKLIEQELTNGAQEATSQATMNDTENLNFAEDIDQGVLSSDIESRNGNSKGKKKKNKRKAEHDIDQSSGHKKRSSTAPDTHQVTVTHSSQKRGYRNDQKPK